MSALTAAKVTMKFIANHVTTSITGLLSLPAFLYLIGDILREDEIPDQFSYTAVVTLRYLYHTKTQYIFITTVKQRLSEYLHK